MIYIRGQTKELRYTSTKERHFFKMKKSTNNFTSIVLQVYKKHVSESQKENDVKGINDLFTGTKKKRLI